MAESTETGDARRRKRPWWQWVGGGLLLLVILIALFGGDDKPKKQATATVTVTQPAEAAATQTTPSAPVQTISDARAAVDDDHYATAVAVAAALGSVAEESIRRRIANRIARRVRSALATGDRGRAKTLLLQADSYPTTALVRQTRASYRAAKDRAAERASARRAAAEQRRQAEAQRRADEQAAEAAPPADAGGNCDPNYSGCVPPYPPDVNCPQVNGPVQVLGSDPHGLDRDGDGVACE
jgi:hypothetical protein